MKKSTKFRQYTFKEEVINSLSHGVMALLCLGGIAPVAIHAYLKSGELAAFGVTVFVVSVLLMFLSSALYHSSAFDSKHRKIMQILDHIFIFVAIAGTYTPICLSVIGGWLGITVLIIQWVMVVFGVLKNSLAKERVPKASLTIYLVMGWSFIIIAPLFIKNSELPMQLLILAGGIFYSAGTYFYAKKEKAFFHTIWHFFVILGVVSHFLAIFLFI